MQRHAVNDELGEHLQRSTLTIAEVATPSSSPPKLKMKGCDAEKSGPTAADRKIAAISST